MKAGKTDIEINTRIRTTRKWDKDEIVTGRITHPFGQFGAYDKGAVAGIYIDEEFAPRFGRTGNLMRGDFEVIS